MSDDLVKRICQQWIDAGCADECFWEQWPHCPSGQDSLTPRMVLDRIKELEAKLRASAMQELAALGQAQDAHQAQLEAEAKLAWQPIETAPKDGTRVWAYWPTTNGDGVSSNAAQVETWYGPRSHLNGVDYCWQTAFEWGDDIGPCRPTHWMPLPAKPTGGKDGDADGFTPALKEICRERCAEYGDPPCWKLPELVQPCDHITPCDECLAEIKGGKDG